MSASLRLSPEVERDFFAFCKREAKRKNVSVTDMIVRIPMLRRKGISVKGNVSPK